MQGRGGTRDGLSILASPPGPELAPVVRKVGGRLVWYLFALYFVSVLDRGNLAFAALSMNHDVGIGVTLFGLGVGIFFLGYASLEVPSNLALARFGARVTLTRIAFLWGLAAVAMAFVVGPVSFLSARFLLGAAEAGLTPGVMLFLSFWIPSAYRARYNSLFFYAGPLAYILGSIASGYLLKLDGTLGLHGWQWLFLLEGLPAIALAIVGLFYLDDRPANARWLSSHERHILEESLAQRVALEEAGASFNFLAIFRSRLVILCCVAYLGVLIGNVTLQAWLPQIVRGYGVSIAMIGWVCAIPPLAGLSLAYLFGRHSDRSGERVYHTMAFLLLAAVGYGIVFLNLSLVTVLIGFSAANVGIYSATAIFWTIPQTFLPKRVAPAAMGLISSIAALGGWLAPTAIGWVQKVAGSLTSGFLVAAIIFIVSAGAMALIRGAIPAGDRNIAL